MAEKRTALLVRCTEAEAQQIREAAKRERRTISGYVLHAVMNRITSQGRAFEAYLTRNPPKAKAAGASRIAQD